MKNGMKKALAFLLAALTLLSVFGCDGGETPAETTGETSGETGNETVPATEPQTEPVTEEPQPDPVEISFTVYADEEEKTYIYDDHESVKSAGDDRFCDGYRYIVYRFPTGGNNSASISMRLENQYELSASSDGKNFTVLASTLTFSQGGRLTDYDLTPFAGGKYIYVKIADADPSDGWGGLISKMNPVTFTAGMKEPVSTEADMIAVRGNATMKTWNLAPASDAEARYLYEDHSTLKDFGDTVFRLCDSKMTAVYRFQGVKGQSAFVTFDLSAEYQIGLSADGKTYDEVLDFTTSGRFRDLRGVDLTGYFADSDTVYMKVSDKTPDDGWGPQIKAMSYTEITGGKGDARISINDGWKADGKDYTVGKSLTVSAGKTVTFERNVTLPDSMVTGLGVSFGFISSASDPVVKIDGKEAALLSSSGGILAVKIPEDAVKKGSFTVTVTAKADKDGKVGLAENIRLGYEGLVSYPEPSYTLDGKTTPLTFAFVPYDTVKLNALAGNYLASLYNKELGINSFDSSVLLQDLYYVGDTARALIALAYEEIYSPVVRLDYAMGIYKMLRGAIVPTTVNRVFLKYDNRPKRIRAEGGSLVWTNAQDVLEPFADMGLIPEGDDTAKLTSVLREEKDNNGGMDASFKGTKGTVKAAIDWYDGTSDRATTAALSSDCAYRVEISFEKYVTYPSVAVDDEKTVLSAKSGEIETSDRYFFLSGQYWHTDGVLVTSDLIPADAETVAEDGKITKLILYFDKGDEPIISLVGIQAADTDLKYPFYLADHILTDGSYGCSGYDPTYICDHSLGGLAAGAYLMKKYGVEGWEEAVEFAAAALKECDREIEKDHYIPDFWESPIAGCDFMIRCGKDPLTFRKYAGKWADRVVADQRADGSYLWLDTRNTVAVLIAYDLTGNEKYLNSVKKFVASNQYADNGVTYGGKFYSELSFTGAGDAVLLTRLGREDAIDIVLKIAGMRIDDSAFFACSDLNPYFLGLSLNGSMKKTYGADEKKQILRLGEYCLYDENGTVTVTNQPTCYINNPYNH